MTEASRVLGLALVFGLISFKSLTLHAETLQILVGHQLEPGFDMGVVRMDYPAGQSWGAVFVTVGPPRDPPRPFQDFSSFRTLVVEMKGGANETLVRIGVKSNTQRDDGREVKMSVTLSPDWHAYQLPLKAFRGADLSRLYVVTEFVFEGSLPQTVYVRGIAFQR
jgi:hypothetical protein